ncbi:MAG: exodeoxyribonuclease VII [Coriobacteriia bacterium]|nr:MAG: exodeoxyribonuclease VII [Coriobacteriia bacterium]
MARVDTSKYQTFPQITERLDDIVSQVRDKDISLERSLDLFDEAIALGSKAVDMVDATDFSPEEAAQLEEQAADKGKGAVAADGVAGDGEGADEQGDSSSKDTPAKENA